MDFENQILRVIYISFIIMFLLLLALIIANGTGNLVKFTWIIYAVLILISPIIIISVGKAFKGKGGFWKIPFLAITILMFILSVIVMLMAKPNITMSIKIYGGIFITMILIANIFVFYYKTKLTLADKTAIAEGIKQTELRLLESLKTRYSSEQSVSPPAYTETTPDATNRPPLSDTKQY